MFGIFEVISPDPSWSVVLFIIREENGFNAEISLVLVELKTLIIVSHYPERTDRYFD